MIYEQVLEYLAEKSGVPIWIISKDANVVYSTIHESKRASDTSMMRIFSAFTGHNESALSIKKFNTNELYGHFISDDEEHIVVAGPAYELHPYSGGKKGSATALYNDESIKKILLLQPIITLSEFCRYVAVLAQIFTKQVYDSKSLEAGLEKYFLRDLINEQLAETIFDIREEERETVYEPEAEKKIVACVTKGDVESLQKFRMPKVKDLNAKETKLQDLFEGVALVTLATRAAIEGGLDYVVAFSLSDLYFNRLSKVTNDKELSNIISEVLPHFAQKVREIIDTEKKEVSSPYIIKSVQYIRSHLHAPIHLEEVAQYIGLEPKYFSRHFVKSTGEKFSSFVQKERIQEAKALLENTNRTVIDISNSLCFSSQSYFIKVFSRYVGETPGEYLEMHKRFKKI